MPELQGMLHINTCSLSLSLAIQLMMWLCLKVMLTTEHNTTLKMYVASDMIHVTTPTVCRHVYILGHRRDSERGCVECVVCSDE